MAADILLYGTDLVPVGVDQKQHVELCRDIAIRFNGVYGDVFKIPEPFIPEIGAKIMSLTSPENKMSKSDPDPAGCIYLMQKPEEIMRSFKRAVTDSETPVVYDPVSKPGVSNLMTIYSSASGKTAFTDRRRIRRAGLRDVQDRGGRGRRGDAETGARGGRTAPRDKAYLERIYAKARSALPSCGANARKVYKKWALSQNEGPGICRPQTVPARRDGALRLMPRGGYISMDKVS